MYNILILINIGQISTAKFGLWKKTTIFLTKLTKGFDKKAFFHSAR